MGLEKLPGGLGRRRMPFAWLARLIAASAPDRRRPAMAHVREREALPAGRSAPQPSKRAAPAEPVLLPADPRGAAPGPPCARQLF
jgi:hypothetical protein